MTSLLLRQQHAIKGGAGLSGKLGANTERMRGPVLSDAWPQGAGATAGGIAKPVLCLQVEFAFMPFLYTSTEELKLRV